MSAPPPTRSLAFLSNRAGPLCAAVSDDDEKELSFELDIEPADARAEQAAPPAVVPSVVAPPVVAPPVAAPPPAAPSQPPRAYTPPPFAEADDSNRKTAIIGVVLLLVGALTVYFFYWDDWFPPDADDVVANLSEAPNGAVQYDGELYPSQWTPEEELGGIVNQVARGHFSQLPFVTHAVVLVTGDYADPEKVQIGDLEDHQVNYAATSTPNGTIVLVHVVPADAAALAALRQLKPGQWATLQGDLLNGNLVAPDQVALRTMGPSKVFRLRTVSSEQPDDDGEEQ
jgi:hypothetical protein